MRRKTQEWLESHFAGKFSAAHFCNHYTGGMPVRKSEVCSNRKIQILIEDSLIHLMESKATGVYGILLDQPWNEVPESRELPRGIERVKTWEGILEKVKQFDG